MKVFIVVYMFKTWREIGGAYECIEKAQDEIDRFKLHNYNSWMLGDEVVIIEREVK